jgi:hypothetical protein
MLVSDIVATDHPEEIRKSSALYCSCVSGAISEDEYLAGLRAVGLVDVEVRARLVYDADQLEGLAGSDSGCGCGLSKEDPGAYPEAWPGRCGAPRSTLASRCELGRARLPPHARPLATKARQGTWPATAPTVWLGRGGVGSLFARSPPWNRTPARPRPC